jgi:hypothetical protein
LAVLVPENNLRSYSRPFPRTEHDPPIVDRVFFEQQDFKLPTRVSIHAAEASGDHARIVEYQEIALVKVIEEVAEPPMLNQAGVTMHNEQTRQISLRRGHLRDQFWRQLKVKVHSSHVARALFQCSSGARRQVQGVSGKENVLSPPSREA